MEHQKLFISFWLSNEIVGEIYCDIDSDSDYLKGNSHHQSVSATHRCSDHHVVSKAI